MIMYGPYCDERSETIQNDSAQSKGFLGYLYHNAKVEKIVRRFNVTMKGLPLTLGAKKPVPVQSLFCMLIWFPNSLQY